MKNKLIIDLNGRYLNYVYLTQEEMHTINVEIQKDLTNYVVESLKWLVNSRKIDLDDKNLEIIYVNGPGGFTNVRLGTLIVKILMIFHPTLNVYTTNKLQLYADDTKKEVDYFSTYKSIYFVQIHDHENIIESIHYLNNVDFESLKDKYQDYEFVDLSNISTSDSKENLRKLNFNNLTLINSYNDLNANYLKDPNIDQSVLNKSE